MNHGPNCPCFDCCKKLIEKLNASELRRMIAATNPFNRIEDREAELKRNLQTR